MSEILMELCQMAVRMTNDFKRPISVYRSPQGEIIHVYSYLEPDHRWICLDDGDMHFGRGKRGLYLFPDTRKFSFDFIRDRPGKRTCRKRFPEEEGAYLGPDIRKGGSAFKIIWLFLELLTKPGLARVDPYNICHVLEGEETEADKIVAVNVAMVERFEEGLKGVEWKPGIITPADAPRVNN